MDLEFFKQLLSFDSTSGREREVAEWLFGHLEAPEKELMEVGDGTLNLLLRWPGDRSLDCARDDKRGGARDDKRGGDRDDSVIFCTHMDTVPPYIAPRFTDDVIYGRGSCDAKGQILALYTACKELEKRGKSGFGLLLLAGEETGSWGAKAFSRTLFRAKTLIIGEPTENRQVTASKGTKSYALTFHGEPFHSGYPQYGRSAVAMFQAFLNELDAAGFPEDPLLGPTTWNVGELRSDNPQNVLSPELRCRLYFRTTFASDAAVVAWMAAQARPGLLDIEARGGDEPRHYLALEGLPQGPASFGSDAPHLTGFSQKIICGPGSIRHAHRDDEQIALVDLETAVKQYLVMYERLC